MNMFDYFKKHLIGSISLALLVLAIFIYLISNYLSESPILPGFLSNMSASLIILAITIYLINPVLEKDKENKWKAGPNQELIKDFTLLSNMTATYLLSPLGIEIYDFINPNNTNLEKEAEVGINKMLASVTQEKIELLLRGLSKDGWEHLTMDIILVRNEIKEDILVYEQIMPRKLLTEILSLRVKFKAIDTNVGLFSSIFLHADNDWVERTDKRRHLFDNFCRDISQNISEYLSSVSKFRKTLAEINQ